MISLNGYIFKQQIILFWVKDNEFTKELFIYFIGNASAFSKWWRTISNARPTPKILLNAIATSCTRAPGRTTCVTVTASASTRTAPNTWASGKKINGTATGYTSVVTVKRAVVNGIMTTWSLWRAETTLNCRWWKRRLSAPSWMQ